VTRGMYFLVAFSYLRKAPIGFVVSVFSSSDYLSIRMYQLGAHWTDICEI